ncbi:MULTISPECIES: DHA2 family efflux MFS transporter permease subunit [Actinomadura]|uniref:DHA2 family efflux MFS transporter permease subunit n=1 Tax=Actinomadura yumaensis TaxID=111807 RepID=A0ABW2CKV1_9ACTN|nr:DHA2 family efflux MFS transporter permease subunit [Actinomadura sp. J1-007]MWK32998.1 DHA2 family efflux MFS transporter permease subunit [Actinomadura sp. J1-007]
MPDDAKARPGPAGTRPPGPEAGAGAGTGAGYQEQSDRLDRRVIVLGLVIVSGTLMAILDTTIVNVALQTLGRDFHASLSTIQWVITGYLLALGTVIPITGWAVDRFGGRRVWMTSIVLFVLGSALSGAAWNIESLIAFRVVQGLGGGMLMPTGMAILTMAAGPRRLGRVMSIVGIPMLLGPVLGPILGGWLVEDVQWRWIFFVNLPVGAVALALAWWKIPRAGGEHRAATLDVRGLLLLPPGFVLLIYGLSTASSSGGFGSPSTIAWLAGGAALVALFAVHSARLGERALIDVRLFRDRVYATAAGGVFFVGTALMGSMLLIPLYYQLGRGEGALAAGLLLAPQGLGAATAMPFSGLLTDKLGAGRVVPVGVVLLVLGTIPFVLLESGTSYWLLGAALYVRGLGLGCTMMPTMSAALTTLGRAAVSRATGALNIIVQLGGSFGTALLAVILSRELGSGLPKAPGGSGGGVGEIPAQVRERFGPQIADAFGGTFWVALGLTAVLIVPALLLPRHGASASGGTADEDVPVNLPASH